MDERFSERAQQFDHFDAYYAAMIRHIRITPSIWSILIVDGSRSGGASGMVREKGGGRGGQREWKEVKKPNEEE